MVATENQPEHAGDRLRREAWRRTRFRVWIALALMAVLVLSIWWVYGFQTHFVVTLAAFFAIAIYAIVVRYREMDQSFLAGARGEELVEERLRALASRGWQYRNNLPKPNGGDIDHVLWGPRGVFVIETKATRGRVTLEAGRLTFDRHMPEEDFVQQSYQNALLVRDHLCKELQQRVWVTAILCLTRAFIDEYRIDIGSPPVHVMKVERLMEFVQGFDDTSRLTDEMIARIGEGMRKWPAEETRSSRLLCSQPRPVLCADPRVSDRWPCLSEFYVSRR